MTAFWTTLGIVFLAELGDKTQLTAMALAVRYPWRRIFIGMAAAFALLNLVAVAVGQLLFSIVPMTVIQGISGGLFFIFGILTLWKAPDGTADRKQTFQNPMLTAFVMILLSELGDKTQIVTAALAAQYPDFLPVFLGSTLALWSVSLLGIFLGQGLTRLLPMSTIHRAAGVLFLLLGLGMFIKLLG